jgi:hypothetical protein
MQPLSSAARGATRAAAALVATAAVILGLTTTAAARSAGELAAGCGTELSGAEIAEVQALSNVDAAAGPGSRSLAAFESLADRHRRITDILLRHDDRRGLFSVGLDAVLQSVVLPLQRDEGAFPDRGWAHAISADLLARYLRNLHAEFTGAPVEPHWARYFDLATGCGNLPTLAAMAGYNAHLTVDLARAVAASGTRIEHIPSFYRLVDSIALSGDAIVDRTRFEYGADLGPLWRLYFVGDLLDQQFGKSAGSEALLRLADNGYNTITLAHGLALQQPALAPNAAASVDGLWWFADSALTVVAAAGGL